MVQRNRRSPASLAKWPVASPSLVALTPVMVASLAALSCGGCSVGDTSLSSTEMSAAQSSAHRADTMLGASRVGGQPAHLTVSPRQQAYLDALDDAGMHPSEDLMALSIGAYVCQARAARQTDQAVWDFVLPLVRNDLSDSHAGSVAPEVGDVDAATADYIRIATERLC